MFSVANMRLIYDGWQPFSILIAIKHAINPKFKIIIIKSSVLYMFNLSGINTDRFSQKVAKSATLCL